MTDEAQIGRGPWARSLASTVVVDEGAPAAAAGRALALSGGVRDLSVAEGTIAARVAGQDGREHTVTLVADPVSPPVWDAVFRFARGKRTLDAAAQGREQSAHLGHLMAEDWEEPLVPRAGLIRRACTCDEGGSCGHVAALGVAFADAIDEEPVLLLRWRGCILDEVVASGDPWAGGDLPEPGEVRPMPVGAVLKRLGPSGIAVGEDDLAQVLERAYEAFAGL
jgi:uncharacterized Zn finger protein